jgi:hypothetical protein
MYGPLEYVVVRFTGNNFTGELLPVLMDVEEVACVRLVDLVFIRKNESNDITLIEISEMDEEDATAYEALTSEFHGVLTAEDVAEAAVNLPLNSSAGVFLFEHLWAIDLQSAIKSAGGQMIESGYIHPISQVEVIAEMERMEEDDAS